MKIIVSAVVCFCLLIGLSVLAQQKTPFTIRVDVIGRTTKAVNYLHRDGSTTIDFRGTALQPGARGEAKVESKRGYTEIEAEFDDMIPPNRYGREYLTYVMWAVTPQGRSQNLGELVLKGTKSKLDVTTDFQNFALIITAEPYFAVSQPTDRVVLENFVRPDTKGIVEETAQYEVLDKNSLAFARMPNELKPTLIDTSLPLDLQQARHAVNIAQWVGADRYAPDLMSNTRDMLYRAEEYFVKKAGPKPISTVARSVVQNAEDARLIALSRQQAEELRRPQAPTRPARKR